MGVEHGVVQQLSVLLSEERSQNAVNGDGYFVTTSFRKLAPHIDTFLVDLNLPLTGVAAILVLVYLKLRTPGGSLREKVSRMDWM